MSDDDAGDAEGSLSKRSRNGVIPEADEDGQTPVKTRESSPEAESELPSAGPAKETEGVRQVTKGVKEVELEDKQAGGLVELQDEETKAEGSAEGSSDAPEDVQSNKLEESSMPEAPAAEEGKAESSAAATSTKAPEPPKIPEEPARSIVDSVTADKSDDIASSEPDSEQTAVRSSPSLEAIVETGLESKDKLPTEASAPSHEDLKVVPTQVAA